jgi:hypothetical protein
MSTHASAHFVYINCKAEKKKKLADQSHVTVTKGAAASACAARWRLQVCTSGNLIIDELQLLVHWWKP